MTHPQHELSLEDLRQIAGAARLGLSAGDMERLYPQMAGYLDVLTRLRQVDVTGVPPATRFSAIEE